MTRSSKLALVTLLAGLLSLVPVSIVNADAPCTGYAPEHCAQMAAADDAILFHAAIAPIPVHILSARGVGQEQFEAMTMETVSIFAVAAPATVAAHLPGYAPERFEELMSK